MCDNGWDLKDAEVACRELGCGIALQAGRYAYFGQGTGNFFRSNMDCSGSETSLDYCRYSISYSCNFGRDAGVVCSGKKTFLWCLWSYHFIITVLFMYLSILRF